MESNDYSAYQNKRLLITGSNGFVGTAIYRRLEFLGFHSLFLTSSSQNKLEHASFLKADFSDSNEVESVLEWCKPEIIINTAAISSIEDAFNNPEKAFQVNKEAPAQIAAWCKKRNCRMAHFSTDFVFDGSKTDLVETDGPAPLSVYGESKRAGEVDVSNINSKAVIIRPILVYGEKETWHRHNFLTWLSQAIKEKALVSITSDQVRQPTYINDLVRATLDLTFSSLSGLYNISGGESINMMDFARKVVDNLGEDSLKLMPISTDDLGAPEKRPLLSGFNMAKAKNAIGYNPKSIDQVLKGFK